jgi:hypothetical protein
MILVLATTWRAPVAAAGPGFRQGRRCAMIAEALEDHFGAHCALDSSSMTAFDNGRNRIRSVCAEEIDQNGGKA